MSLMQHIDQCLRDAGYRVQFHPDRPSTIYFEDQSLFGFATAYDSVESLLQTWNGNQEEFLHKHAPFLRMTPRKAWNCYTLHMTDAQATAEEAQALFDIEENFTSTRKIARASVSTALDVQRALYPLIPVQNLVNMQQAQQTLDITQRFHDWPESALKALLGSGSPEDVVELLLEVE